MPDRRFDMTQSAGHRRCYRVTCKKCGVSDAVEPTGHSGVLPPEAIRKKLVQRGWSIGQSSSSDICPGCMLAKSDPRALVLKIGNSGSSIPIGVVDVTKELTMLAKVEQPRVMSRDDRRIIHDKINQHHLGEKQGYDKGWDDTKIAKDLGVPRAWVTDIREEWFGVESSIDVVKLQADIEKIDGEIAASRKALDQLSNLSTAAKALIAAAQGVSEDAKRRLSTAKSA